MKITTDDLIEALQEVYVFVCVMWYLYSIIIAWIVAIGLLLLYIIGGKFTYELYWENLINLFRKKH